MTYAEFVEHGTDLTVAILGRVPERWRPWLVGEIEHGIQAPMIFMTNLVFMLDELQVPITPDERDRVARLMKHRSMDLRPVGRFNVTEGTTMITVEEARERAERIVRMDLAGETPDLAHAEQDALWVEVLRAIANRHPKPAKVAEQCVRIADVGGRRSFGPRQGQSSSG